MFSKYGFASVFFVLFCCGVIVFPFYTVMYCFKGFFFVSFKCFPSLVGFTGFYTEDEPKKCPFFSFTVVYMYCCYKIAVTVGVSFCLCTLSTLTQLHVCRK